MPTPTTENRPLDGYYVCPWCGVGRHDLCDGESRIYHVGGSVTAAPCECPAPHETKR